MISKHCTEESKILHHSWRPILKQSWSMTHGGHDKLLRVKLLRFLFLEDHMLLFRTFSSIPNPAQNAELDSTLPSVDTPVPTQAGPNLELHGRFIETGTEEVWLPILNFGRSWALGPQLRVDPYGTLPTPIFFPGFLFPFPILSSLNSPSLPLYYATDFAPAGPTYSDFSTDISFIRQPVFGCEGTSKHIGSNEFFSGSQGRSQQSARLYRLKYSNRDCI